MEFLQGIVDGNWSSFIDATMSSVDESSDMLCQFMIGTCSSIFPNQTDNNFLSNNNSVDNICQNNHEVLFDPTTLYSSYADHHHHHQAYVPSSFNVISSSLPLMDFCMSQEQEQGFEIDPNYLLGEDQICRVEETSSSSLAVGKRKTDHDLASNYQNHEISTTTSTTTTTTTTDDHHLEKEHITDDQKRKKRARGAPKVKKTTRTRRSKKSQKNLKSTSDDEQDGSAVAAPNGQQSSSNCNSEYDSNGSAIQNKGGRGSASDPQSLYARKRRERINERLKILQNLVPNGTKVDISTMLEEAVNYVKFLQLQIKLLSSDDLWMYAPLAYNGVDIGLNLHQISSLKK